MAKQRPRYQRGNSGPRRGAAAPGPAPVSSNQYVERFRELGGFAPLDISHEQPVGRERVQEALANGFMDPQSVRRRLLLRGGLNAIRGRRAPDLQSAQQAQNRLRGIGRRLAFNVLRTRLLPELGAGFGMGAVQ